MGLRGGVGRGGVESFWPAAARGEFLPCPLLGQDAQQLCQLRGCANCFHAHQVGLSLTPPTPQSSWGKVGLGCCPG